MNEATAKVRRLAWTRTTAEQFWRGTYDAGLRQPHLLRERARHLGFLLATHAEPATAVTLFLERDGVLDDVLCFAGFDIGRIDVGPRHDGSEGSIRNVDPCDGSQALILVPDALAQLTRPELVHFFATVRACLGSTGRLVLTVANNENLDQGLAIDPISAVMLHTNQHVLSFTPEGLELLLRDHGFVVEVLQQVELTDVGFSRQSNIAASLAERPRIHIGSGDTIFAIARVADHGGRSDLDPARWLAVFQSARRDAGRRPDPYALVWNEALITSFWSNVANSPLDELSFGRVNAAAFMQAVSPWLTHGRRILDVGAGDGFLSEFLLRNGYSVAAFEPADDRRRSLDARVRNLPNFLGTIDDLKDRTPFDCVIATEVIEHIPDAGLPDFLYLLWNSLVPGGVLLLTTPRCEVLERSRVYSPISGAVFHRWQHMQSWTAERLRGLIEERGFQVDRLVDVDFTAIASGAAPYVALEFASNESVTIGVGGTWLCIARRSPADSNWKIESPRVLSQARPRDIRLASADRADIHANSQPVQFAGVKDAFKLMFSAIAHGPIRQIARKLLPTAVKTRLVRLKNLAEARYANGPKRPSQALVECAAILGPDEFDTGRVILVNNALAWGGVERQVVNLLRGLETNGHACDLLCVRLGENADHDFFLPQLDSFRGFVRNARSLATARKVLSQLSSKQLARIEKTIDWMPKDVQDEIRCFLAEFVESRPRAVHAWQDSVSIAAGYAAQIAGVPVIVMSSRNLNPTNFAYHRPYMAAAYRQLAACEKIQMVNNSEAGVADYAQWLRIPVERFKIHRNGVDPTFFSPASPDEVSALRTSLGIPEGAAIVGSIFRFYLEKDPYLWVETAGLVASKRPDVHFVIFGVGPLKRKIESYAKSLGLAGRLHLPAIIERPNAAYGMFNVFLLSSRFEGTPNVIIEASMLGVPIVTVPAGGAAEAVDDGITGFVVRERDPVQIAEKVLAVLDDPEWAARAADFGPNFIQTRFGLERMVNEAIGYYQFEAAERMV